MKKLRLAIFASGNGSNAIQIHSYFEKNPNVTIVTIYTDNSKAGIIERGVALDLTVKILTKEEINEGLLLVDQLRADKIDVIILAGYLKKIQPELIRSFPNRIINIHPALLPKFGGKGMYGMHVHNAVKLANEKESGITIHLVNENYDEGKQIAQFSCKLMPEDTPEDIQKKVQILEHEHFAPTINKYLESLN